MATIQFPKDYPQKPPFYAHSFSRLLTKAAVAQSIGTTGCWLLTIIAMQEDVCRYRRPITYFDSQLCAIMGITQETLTKYRTQLIEMGWLHFERPHHRAVSYYWVQIPPQYATDFEEDRSCDEGIHRHLTEKIGQTSVIDRSNAGQTSVIDRSNAAASYPIPNPNSSTPFLNSDGGGISDTQTRTASAADDVGSRTSHSTGDRVAASAICGDHVAPPALGMAQTATEPAQPNEIRDLARRLRDLGCDLAESCISQSMQAGYGLREIADIVAYAEARPGFWGGGAIYRRLTRASTALPCDRGWCAPEEKAVARASAEAAKLATQQTLAKCEQPTKAVQREFDFEAAERLCGSQIDSAPLDELRIALPKFWRPKLKTRDDVQRGKSLRLTLLRALAPQCAVPVS